LVPLLLEQEFEPFACLLYFMVDPTEVHRERHSWDPVQE
jgi:hypothetical protein